LKVDSSVKAVSLYEFSMEEIVLPHRMRYEPLEDFFLEAVVDKLNKRKIASMKPGSGRTDERVVVRGRFVSADGGSRLKRYFLPFFAGAAVVTVEGEVLDSGERIATIKAKGTRRVGMVGGETGLLILEAARLAGDSFGDQLVALLREVDDQAEAGGSESEAGSDAGSDAGEAG
jgi:hypothetical protein